MKYILEPNNKHMYNRPYTCIIKYKRYIYNDIYSRTQV